MTHYFWRKEDLSASQIQRLGYAHIPFQPHKLSGLPILKLWDADGYLFDSEAHDRAKKLLGARITRERNSGSFRKVELEFDGLAKYGTYVCCWSHQDSEKEYFRVAAERILFPSLNCDIVLHGTAGEYEEANESMPGFHVHMFSTPEKGKRAVVTCPNLLWGLPVVLEDRMFAPTAGAHPIYDSQNMQVGEIVGTHAYLFLPLNLHDDNGSIQLFECFCYALLHALKRGGKTPETIANDARAESRQAYAYECQGRIVQEIETSRQRLQYVREEICRTRAALMLLIEEERYLNTALPLLEMHQGDEYERYAEEFDELCASPKIENAYFADSVFYVITKPLYWRHPLTHDVYEIGAMRIQISTHAASEAPLKIFNLTRQVDGNSRGMHHPHISACGTPCWGRGTTQQTFTTLIGRRELAAAVNFAIQFVETVNHTESWGAHFAKWPRVEEARVFQLEAQRSIPIR